VGKPEWKRLLGRSKLKGEDGIKLILVGEVWSGFTWLRIGFVGVLL
jgi:hypothetical protein